MVNRVIGKLALFGKNIIFVKDLYDKKYGNRPAYGKPFKNKKRGLLGRRPPPHRQTAPQTPRPDRPVHPGRQAEEKEKRRVKNARGENLFRKGFSFSRSSFSKPIRVAFFQLASQLKKCGGDIFHRDTSVIIIGKDAYS